MESTYTTTIKPAYIKLRAIYLGAEAVRDNVLVVGERVTTPPDEELGDL